MEDVMAKLSEVQASRTLLGILASVESGVTTAEDARVELDQLRDSAPETFRTRVNYTVGDLKKLRQDYIDETYDMGGYE
jgi:hypothetical protein